jgi:glutathione S-transferase
VVANAGGIPLTLKSDFILSEIRDSLPFGQVPLLVDGDIRFSQSQAILRYLARKGGLQGETDADFALSEMLIEESRDINALMDKAISSSNKNAAYDEMFSEGGAITQQLRFVERLLSAERTFFSSGDSRLAGEYVLGCVLNAVQLVQPNALAHFPKLMRFFDAIFVLPAYDGVKDLRCPAHFLRDP